MQISLPANTPANNCGCGELSEVFSKNNSKTETHCLELPEKSRIIPQK
jgi:hypothetical protein